MKKGVWLWIFLLFILSCKDKTGADASNFEGENMENAKVLLRLKAKEGERLKMGVSSTFSTDKGIDSRTDVTFYFNLNTASVEDSAITYNADIQRLKMKASFYGMSIDYDSQKENSGILASIDEQVKPILGNKVSLKMSPLAQVKAVKWNRKVTDFPTQTPTFGGICVPFPEEEVGVGDTWRSSMDLGTGSVPIIFKVKKITTKYIYISLQNDSPNGDNSAELKGDYTLNKLTNFTHEGHIYASIKEGDVPMDLEIKIWEERIDK